MTTLLAALPLLFFQATPGYTVAGTLVDGGTGAPLAKARVSLSGVANPVTTGADGRFQFTGVRAGMHQLGAERLGYVHQFYQQRSLSTQLSTGIAVGENQSTASLIFRLARNAVIAGYVRDANGEPVVGVSVIALRVLGRGPTRRIGGPAGASTDDRGYYRVSALAGGTYALAVSGRPRYEIASVQPMTYPMTFFPGATDPSAAGFVTVKPGQEASADVVMHAVPAVHLSGEISMAGGALPPMWISLAGPTLFGFQLGTGEQAGVFNGKFDFMGVAAGKYRARVNLASTDSNESALLAVKDVDVLTDPTHVSIAVTQPLRVSIHMVVEGQPKYPNAPRTVGLAPLDHIAMEAAQLGPDGRVTLPWYPTLGRYTIDAGQGSRLPVTSLTVNGVPKPGLAFALSGDGPVQIEAVAQASTVNIIGHVVRNGNPQAGVLAVLAQRDTWEQIGLYRADQSNTDGSFEWPDLPPGEYLAFALEEGEPNDYDDPDSLRPLMPIAQPVTATDGPGQTFELKLLPLPAK